MSLDQMRDPYNFGLRHEVKKNRTAFILGLTLLQYFVVNNLNLLYYSLEFIHTLQYEIMVFINSFLWFCLD